jgi:hypothetical protein
VFILARVSLFVLLLLCAIGTWGMNIHTTASCQAYISTTQIAEGIAMTSVSLELHVWSVDGPLSTFLKGLSSAYVTSICSVAKWCSCGIPHVRPRWATIHLHAFDHDHEVG